MKNKVLAMLCAGVCALGMTACGDEEKAGSKNGYSSPEKAFEAYSSAMVEWDAEKMLTLVPEEYIKLISEKNGYDINELEVEMQSVIESKWTCGKGTGDIVLEEIEYKDRKYVEEFGDLMEANEEKLGKVIEYEDFCHTHCEVIGEKYSRITGDENYISFYKQDGKWYSENALWYILYNA